MFTRTIARHRVGKGEITITHELPGLSYDGLSMRQVRTNIRFRMMEPESNEPMVLDLGADGESWFSVAHPVNVLVRVAQEKIRGWTRGHWFRTEVERALLRWLNANRAYLVKLATQPPRINRETYRKCTPVPPPPTEATPSPLPSPISAGSSPSPISEPPAPTSL